MKHRRVIIAHGTTIFLSRMEVDTAENNGSTEHDPSTVREIFSTQVFQAGSDDATNESVGGSFWFWLGDTTSGSHLVNDVEARRLI